MLIKKPLKITPKKLSGILAITISLISVIILSSVSLFLYKNFYQTITETKEIMVLKQKVAVDTIDINKFNRIIDNLTKKISPKEAINLISPFR